MKKNKIFCLIIFVIYLIVASFVHFNSIISNQIEYGKTILVVSQTEYQNGDLFTSIDDVMFENGIDYIVKRGKWNSGKLIETSYYSTTMSPDFLNINMYSETAPREIFVISNFDNEDEAVCYRMSPSPVFFRFSIYHISELQHDNLSSLTILIPNENLDKAMSVFNSLNINVEKDVSVNYGSGIVLGEYLTGILYLMASLFYELSSGKRHMLLKMDGYSSLDIAIREFKTDIKIIAASLAVAVIVVSVLALSVFRASPFHYLLSQFSVALFAVQIICISFVISVVIPMLHNRYTYVIGNKPLKFNYRVGLIVHLLSFSIFLAIILYAIQSTIIPMYIQKREIRKINEKINNMALFDMTGDVDNELYRYCELNSEKAVEMFNSLNEDYGAIYIDSSLMGYSAEDGKYIWEMQPSEYRFPEIRINETYLSENPIYFPDCGMITSEDLDPNSVNILIPDKYDYSSYEWKYGYLKSEGYFGNLELNYITYDSDSEICLYSTECESFASVKPVIIVYNDALIRNHPTSLDDMLRFGYRFRAEGSSAYDYIHPLLEKYQVDNMITRAIYMQDQYNEMLSDQIQDMESSLPDALLIIFGLAGLILFNAINYTSGEKKEISIKLIEGYTIWSAIKSFIRDLGITYIISAVITAALCIAFSHTLISYVAVIVTCLVIILIDFAFSICQCTALANKNFYLIIKGED
ncbi:MAG: hypothetical protein J6U54_25025 [Clostridiales bacterium]|nr:hypothetical protein [Clostridiales bacterium]